MTEYKTVFGSSFEKVDALDSGDTVEIIRSITETDSEGNVATKFYNRRVKADVLKTPLSSDVDETDAGKALSMQGVQAIKDLIEGRALLNHTHSNYALVSHTHDYGTLNNLPDLSIYQTAAEVNQLIEKAELSGIDTSSFVKTSDVNMEALKKLTLDDVTKLQENTPTMSDLNNYVLKDGAKVLSTNDFTDAYKALLDSLKGYNGTISDIQARLKSIEEKLDGINTPAVGTLPAYIGYISYESVDTVTYEDLTQSTVKQITIPEGTTQLNWSIDTVVLNKSAILAIPTSVASITGVIDSQGVDISGSYEWKTVPITIPDVGTIYYWIGGPINAQIYNSSSQVIWKINVITPTEG